jgi:hypothetical protein
MKIYAILVENELMPTLFTGLRPACNYYNIPYSSASHGKRLFMIDRKKVEIKECSLVKIKGRGAFK